MEKGVNNCDKKRYEFCLLRNNNEKRGDFMLKMLKKYRNDPKRMVVTFSCQRKIVLNRLGDLAMKNLVEKELNEGYPSENTKKSYTNACCGDGASCEKEQSCGASCVGYDSYGGIDYIVEGERLSFDKGSLKEKKAQIHREQSQILEKDSCGRAFKENYHIKPLEFANREEKGRAGSVLKPEKEVRGGIVLEKSFKILLSDLVLLVSGMVALFCVISKLKRLF